MTATQANGITVSEKLKALAPDLTREFPRSPRETLGGYMLAARLLDKCRAHLNGTVGEYLYNFFMDRMFFDFTGIAADELTAYVATGASDDEVAAWIQDHSRVRERLDVVKWNNKLRFATVGEMPDRFQLFMEDYIARVVPPGKVVRTIWDAFDIEEGRL